MSDNLNLLKYLYPKEENDFCFRQENEISFQFIQYVICNSLILDWMLTFLLSIGEIANFSKIFPNIYKSMRTWVEKTREKNLNFHL